MKTRDNPFTKENLQKTFSEIRNGTYKLTHNLDLFKSNLGVYDKTAQTIKSETETIIINDHGHDNFHNLNGSHVICVGDFNDGPYQYCEYEDIKAKNTDAITGKHNYKKSIEEWQKYTIEKEGKGKYTNNIKLENFWQGLKLFNSLPGVNDGILVTSKEIKTCCSGKNYLRGDKFDVNMTDDGDKDNGDIIAYSNNLELVYDLTTEIVELTSDHKPVYCSLAPKGTSFGNKYLKYKNKYLKLKEVLNSY